MLHIIIDQRFPTLIISLGGIALIWSLNSWVWFFPQPFTLGLPGENGDYSARGPGDEAWQGCHPGRAFLRGSLQQAAREAAGNRAGVDGAHYVTFISN